MSSEEYARLESLIENARRAQKAADRLSRIARSSILAAAAELERHKPKCEAERGKAHEHHRDPVRV